VSEKKMVGFVRLGWLTEGEDTEVGSHCSRVQTFKTTVTVSTG
jgi:hypothetical protein